MWWWWCPKTAFYGSRKLRKKWKFCGNFLSETFVNNTFCARSLWGEESFVHGGLVECGGVLVQNSKFQVTPTRKCIAGKVGRCLGGRGAHSREGSHVLEGICRCQNLQGCAHLSQQAAASGRWSVRLDQHQDKLNYIYSYDTAVTRVLRSFPVVAHINGVTCGKAKKNDVVIQFVIFLSWIATKKKTRFSRQKDHESVTLVVVRNGANICAKTKRQSAPEPRKGVYHHGKKVTNIQ